MNIFETTIISLILILFPLLVCILYEAYNKTYDLEKNELCLDFALISSFYLILKYSPLNVEMPLLLINIPLIIGYIKGRKLGFAVINFIIIVYMFDKFNYSLFLLAIEYSIYYLLYKLLKNKKRIIFINLFMFIKITFYLFYGLIYDNLLNSFSTLKKHVVTIILFIIITKIVFFIIKKASIVLKFEKDYKDFQKEKELRLSLFKITHEIKNPITVCKGYLDMFDVENKNQSRNYINILKNEMNRILILLEDFLTIDKIKIKKEIIDLNLLLEEVTNSFYPLLKEKNIKKQIYIDKDELYIMADYNRLNQVLINIIKNSIEAMDQKGILKINTVIDKTNINIIIQDNGIGISDENKAKMKEPFFTTKQKGTGLGIYLSQQIIKAHEGEIHYSSKINEGTCVTVTLPYKKIEL